MVIGLVDVFIIIFLALGGLVGFKSGAIKELTRFIGFFCIILVAFYLKDKLMVSLYENLPFYNFLGIIQGIDALNILLYQLISFLVIFFLLYFILRVLIVITGLVEWLVKMTVFLSLPSKIIGLFIGVLEYYVYIFFVLYVLNMPVFNLSFVSGSKFGGMILKNTPILSEMADDTVEVYGDVWKIIQNKSGKSNSEINSLVLTSLLDHRLITPDSARKLVESNKISIEDKSLIDKYQRDKDFYQELKERYYDQ